MSERIKRGKIGITDELRSKRREIVLKRWKEERPYLLECLHESGKRRRQRNAKAVLGDNPGEKLIELYRTIHTSTGVSRKIGISKEALLRWNSVLEVKREEDSLSQEDIETIQTIDAASGKGLIETRYAEITKATYTLARSEVSREYGGLTPQRISGIKKQVLGRVQELRETGLI